MDSLAIGTASADDLNGLLATDPIAVSNARRRGFLKLAAANGHCEIASLDDERVAFAVWHRQFFSRPFLALLNVAAAHRRRGIGSALVRHVIALAGRDDFFTSTNASNVAAQRLFDKLGFVRSGTIDNIDPGDPEWIYLLRPKG